MSERALPWAMAWQLARRGLSARFKGLRLLLACLFLGVGALAAIGTLTGSIERELASRGRAILGGDLELEVWQRELTPAEQAALAALGTVSTGTRLQAMATAGTGAAELTAPVELKAVDDKWPLVGRLRLKDGRMVGAPPPGAAWLAEGATEGLGLRVGDPFTLGTARLTVGGIIADEPDRLGEGFAWGPPVIVNVQTPVAAGLIAPGSQYRTRALGSLLPVTPGFVFDGAALLRAATYGLLVALVFTAPPLARARAFPAMALMRARVSELNGAWKSALLPVAVGLILICALALATAAQPLVTLYFLAGAAGALGLLAGLGRMLRLILSRLPRPHRPLLRAALANLHRPGAQTGALVTALGFGLSAFVLLAAVQSSLDANIAARVPRRAPDFFVLDVPRDRAGEFAAAVRQTAPQATIRMVPNLRGAILAYGPADHMVRVADLKDIPDDAWALRGERGLTYAADLPEGNALTAGQWWPANYAGPPLVSVDEKLAQSLNLQLGDRIAVSLLGVERTATIASFRRIDWDSMGFNYVLVFTPNAIADAPHNLAATIDLPDEAGAGAARALTEHVGVGRVLWIGAKAVAAARAVQAHQHEQREPPEQRDQHQQEQPARLVLIVQAADGDGDARDEAEQSEQVLHDPAGTAEYRGKADEHADAFIAGPAEHGADHDRDKDLEQHEHPVFLAARAAGKLEITAIGEQHPFHAVILSQLAPTCNEKCPATKKGTMWPPRS